MSKLKYIKPRFHVDTFCFEDSVSASSVTFTTGGVGVIPQIEDWEDTAPTLVEWEFNPPGGN